jgi:hypothetical protein
VESIQIRFIFDNHIFQSLIDLMKALKTGLILFIMHIYREFDQLLWRTSSWQSIARQCIVLSNISQLTIWSSASDHLHSHMWPPSCWSRRTLSMSVNQVTDCTSCQMDVLFSIIWCVITEILLFIFEKYFTPIFGDSPSLINTTVKMILKMYACQDFNGFFVFIVPLLQAIGYICTTVIIGLVT